MQDHPEGGRGADGLFRPIPNSTGHAPSSTATAPISRGMQASMFSAAGQTPAGAAAAAAAQAAMAGPLPPPPPRPAAPKYNPPATLPPTDQPPQRHDRLPSQQQQGASSIDALTSAGIHHGPKSSSSQQSLNQKQPRPQGASEAALSQADPRLPYLQGGGPRPQMPMPEPRPHPQNELGGMGPHPTPSQQITAQAARHEPQRVQQNQAAGDDGVPSSALQFGSMLHVPGQTKDDGSQPMPNPLQFGIPAGMLPGAGLEGRAQPAPGGGQPGHTFTYTCLASSAY